MTQRRSRVVAVGEVMIELTRAAEGSYRLGFGGDTFNTAIYLGRGGTEISYATALGDDRYSEGVHSLARPRAWD